ncbi:MAG: hypothetical protein JNJ78_01440 [Anaerolineae bacterium]|nr:hypothetical protein [Anaerolineae bacterium]
MVRKWFVDKPQVNVRHKKSSPPAPLPYGHHYMAEGLEAVVVEGLEGWGWDIWDNPLRNGGMMRGD